MKHHIHPYQHTIREQVSCCGVGLHSGRTANLTIKPASPDNGIRFLRTDMGRKVCINAHMDKVVDTRLATTLGHNGTTVSTTEHILAALKSSGIDSVDIEVDSAEVPIMDGSAEPFIRLLKKAGKIKQDRLRKILRITKPIHYTDGDSFWVDNARSGLCLTCHLK